MNSPVSRDPTEAALLTIDYEAALDKLVWSQLQGAWQVPAELARLAIATGARSVELEIRAKRLTLTAPGSRLESRTVTDFASLLDRGLEAAERHRAMVALEDRDAFVLAAVACGTLNSLVLQAGSEAGGDRGLRLEMLAGGQLTVVNPGGASLAQPDLELRVEGMAVDIARAERWLRRVGRFAAVPIAINGRRIGRGFDAPLASRRFAAAPKAPVSAGTATTDVSPPPLLTALAIPSRGNAPRLWLLRHGIIATRATVPGYPAFEAAVEMAPAAGPRATAAALRERLNVYVDGIVDSAVQLTIQLGQDAVALSEAVRARVGRLLLEAARKRRRLSEVSGVKIFPLLGAEGRSWASVDEIGRCVRVEAGGVCALDAIAPGQDPRGFALAGRRVLVLGEAERALLGELLCVVFSAPPARIRQGLGHRLRQRLAAWAPALPFAGGPPLPESELSAAERSFLDHLRRTQEVDGIAAEVRFCAGAGRVRRVGEGGLLLPRQNPTVRACVGAVEGDPSWLYPAMLCLAAGRELPGPEARRLWLAGRDRTGTEVLDNAEAVS